MQNWKINRWVFSSLIALALSQEGCSTANQSPDSIAYKTIATVTTTVDSARQAWNTYVAAGNATIPQVQQVAAAYAVYQQSIVVAQAAVITYKTNGDANSMNNAVAAASAASLPIITLITAIVTPQTGK